MIHWTELGALLAVGLVAGTLGGLLGIGGSVIMIPAMGLVFHRTGWDNQHLFQAAAMVVNVVVAVPAMRRHRAAGAIPADYVRVFLPATMLFMIAGVLLSNMFEGETLRLAFAVFLLYVVGMNIRKVVQQARDHTPDEARISTPRASVIGAVTGTLGGLLGIGGGIVSVPLAQMICRLPLRAAIAASASTMVFSSALGASLKLGTLHTQGQSFSAALLIAACLAPTALVGGHIGAGLTHRAPIAALRVILALVLGVMAARMSGVW